MIFELSITDRSHYFGTGYIAGTGDGIVTVNGKPASRPVSVLTYELGSIAPTLVARVWSLPDGRYLIPHLDPSKRYLIMARDLPPNAGEQAMPPAGHDYVEPATELTIDEQRQMWRAWQQSNQ